MTETQNPLNFPFPSSHRSLGWHSTICIYGSSHFWFACQGNQWSDTAFILLWSAYFIQHNGSVSAVVHGRINTFSWLSDKHTLLYGYTYFLQLSPAPPQTIIPIVFIHFYFPVDIWRLSPSWLYQIVHSEHQIRFWCLLHMFAYIHRYGMVGFYNFYSCYFSGFIFFSSHLNSSKVMLHALIFIPWCLGVLNFFHTPDGYLYVFFEEMSIQILCLFYIIFCYCIVIVPYVF